MRLQELLYNSLKKRGERGLDRKCRFFKMMRSILFDLYQNRNKSIKLKINGGKILNLKIDFRSIFDFWTFCFSRDLYQNLIFLITMKIHLQKYYK